MDPIQETGRRGEEPGSEEPGEPTRWFHALFTGDTAAWIEMRAKGRGLRVGVGRTHNPAHKVVGVECTRGQWRDLLHGYHPLAGDGA